MNAPARAPIDALLADQSVSEDFKAHVAPSYAATGQLLGRALVEMGRTAPKPVETRHWIAGYVTHADAGDALAELIERGEIDYRRDDPDIERKHGLYWITTEPQS